ncbi:MAG: RNA 2'-phosphotransferase [Desulfobacteraceae bacterium]
MRSKELNRLGKFLTYVLGRHPDEFGLVPDSEGFVKVKELLKAVNEEPGWHHLRQNHLTELRISHTKAPIEIVDFKIRATDREQLPVPHKTTDFPKLLYTCIRTRAIVVVLEKGIFPRADPWVVLSSEQTMALRIGKRIDKAPIVLTVNVQQTLQAQIEILAFGENLYLAPQIPVSCFTPPTLPKEKQDKKEKPQITKPLSPSTPGSFYLDLNQEKQNPYAKKGAKGRKEKGWKEARRKDKQRRSKHRASPKHW